MYNARLNKSALESGRAFVKAFVNGDPGNNFPAGTVELFKALITQGEANWNIYSGYVGKKMRHSSIFGTAVRAITTVTVACELASQRDWVLRMDYAPLPGETITPEEQQFAQETRRMLNLMSQMIETLRAALNVEEAQASEQDEVWLQRLTYARHLAEVGLNVCKPANFSYQHPDTSRWQTIRARVLRNLSTAFTVMARKEELASKNETTQQ